jgi:prepilin-type N-terminal cleavage/methylation domain-containing protein
MCIRNKNGFTLIEALIAMVVFVGIVVPLLVFLYGGKGQARAQDSIVAESFLEQEAKKVQVLPENPAPVIIRSISGVEWKITWDVSGDKIQLCKAVVYKAGKAVTDAGFLRYVAQ